MYALVIVSPEYFVSVPKTFHDVGRSKLKLVVAEPLTRNGGLAFKPAHGTIYKIQIFRYSDPGTNPRDQNIKQQ